jgi:hypothetical protein
MEKSMVVEERFAWEKALASFNDMDKVAAIDLDGVLAAYPEGWLDYLNKELKPNVPFTMVDFNFTDAPLPGIDRRTYMALKHDYREAGRESIDVKAFHGVDLFTKALKDLGYKIVILSARPFRLYKRMMGDTICWLKKNKVLYDAILWDQEKHIRIIEQLPFLKFMVEDNPKVAFEVASLGYQVYLIDRPYNKFDNSRQKITRVSDLMDIIEELSKNEKV